jgi:UDP-N-acetylmuramate--alanine ligase
MNILKNSQHIFFTGIGGIGMSGIAEILIDKGYRVSGSDRQLSDITDYLEKKGAVIYKGHAAENLSDVDLLVYTSAVKKDNPERQEALRRGIPEIRRAEMLAQLMEGKKNVAIAGTHGKTTTTALSAHLAIEGGLDPTVVIGGRLKNLKTNARIGNGLVFITEADEYDRSFLALSPHIAVITNIDADHLDIYQNLQDIRETFISFANRGSKDGVVICCVDDPGVKEIIPEISKSVLSYGFSDYAMFRAINEKFTSAGTTFEIHTAKGLLGQLAIPLGGKHNILNTMASLICALQLGLSFESIKTALTGFEGVDRRFEIKGLVHDIMIVDDYAHHPTEIAATLASARSGWNRRLVVLFQPHLFSRTRDFFREFVSALAAADLVFLAPVYPAREEPLPGISSAIIIDEAKQQGFDQFQYISDMKQIGDQVCAHLQAQDMFITMGAGDIWETGKYILTKLQGYED